MFGSPSREPTVVKTVATAGEFLTTFSSFLATSKESFKRLEMEIGDGSADKSAATDKDEFPNLSFCSLCISRPLGCPPAPSASCPRAAGRLGTREV